MATLNAAKPTHPVAAGPRPALNPNAAPLTHPAETEIEHDTRLLVQWRNARRRQQQQEEASGGGESAEPEVSGRALAALEFRLQRKQAVSNTKRATVRELDGLKGASGGWSP